MLIIRFHVQQSFHHLNMNLIIWIMWRIWHDQCFHCCLLLLCSLLWNKHVMEWLNQKIIVTLWSRVRFVVLLTILVKLTTQEELIGNQGNKMTFYRSCPEGLIQVSHLCSYLFCERKKLQTLYKYIIRPPLPFPPTWPAYLSTNIKVVILNC